MLPNSTKILLLKIPYASSRQKAKWEEYLKLHKKCVKFNENPAFKNTPR